MADASLTGAGGGAAGAAPVTPGPVKGPGSGPRRSIMGTPPWLAALFLLPALVLLGALVAYPIVYTIHRSLYDAGGSGFVGLKNFGTVFSDHGILTAVRNNAIWVVVAPTVATALGLVFAVLTERVRWGTAFKLVVFMPMAISMLAAGIIFRLVYDQDPSRGVANAVVVAVHDTFTSNAAYPGARPGPTATSPRRPVARTPRSRRRARALRRTCRWWASRRTSCPPGPSRPGRRRRSPAP